MKIDLPDEWGPSLDILMEWTGTKTREDVIRGLIDSGADFGIRSITGHIPPLLDSEQLEAIRKTLGALAVIMGRGSVNILVRPATEEDIKKGETKEEPDA